MKQAYQWNAYLAEALGTFFFFLIGIGAGYAVVSFADPGAASASALIVALAHGLALLVMVSAFGAISGGHFNPAVTFGLWLAGKIDSVKGGSYVVAQLIGGFLAAAVAWYIFHGFDGLDSSMAVPTLNENLNLLQGIIVEAVITAVLVVAVFGTAVDGRAPKLGGVAIGLALAAGILLAGSLTGGAANPARWFGPALFALQWDNLLVWIIGPLLGAGIVAAIYRYLFLPEAEDQEAEAG